jgi:hypothetical protein
MSVYTYEKGVDNSDMMVWLTMHQNHRNSLTEIKADKGLEVKVLFGYYKDDKGNGFYSPIAYPVLYGQEKWTTQNNTVFKKTAFSEKDFYELSNNNAKAVTASYIEKAWQEGTATGNKFTDLEIGDVFVFEIAGKVKGIARVHDFYTNNTAIKLEVWTM